MILPGATPCSTQRSNAVTIFRSGSFGALLPLPKRFGPIPPAQCPMPGTMYRFQRRDSFRVRAKGGAIAHLRHPAMPDMSLALRVLDVSAGGCALAVPPDVPPIEAGITIAGVRFELDADTRLETSVTVQHISGGFGAREAGTRMGCAFGQLNGAAERALQRFIDITQRRQRLLTL